MSKNAFALKELSRSPRAICMLIALSLLLVAPTGARAANSANLAEYRQAKLAAGARTLPVPAAIAYREALAYLSGGDAATAEEKLLEAVRYDPSFADAYFTLAMMKLKQFDIEATIYFGQALFAVVKSFRIQSLLLMNTIITIPYMWFIISLVVCFAFALKYMPFAAHKIQEFLHNNLNAAVPGFTAYLLLLLPLVLVPGVITALAYIIILSWMFMYKRERFLVLLLVMPFIAIGLFGNFIKPLTAVTDPTSLTSLITRANDANADERVIRALERTPAEGLEFEKNLALGLAYQQNKQYVSAADYFFRAISIDDSDPMGYINLGNVYFMQGQYKKALEGYRRAEGIDPGDPVCQNNLAQAYIKTFLMKESSKSLQRASELGIEKVKMTYAASALSHHPVLPKTFSNSQMWRIAKIDGNSLKSQYLDNLLVPFTRFSLKLSAWLLIGALVIAITITKLVKPSRLTFQCSNCGRLTCSSCCNTERDMDLCQECGQTINGITSEKVIQALLRQKRQAVFVSRRRAARVASVLLPGVRDISYGRIARGFFLAAVFAFAFIQFFSRGYVVKDYASLVMSPPLWKLIAAVAGMVIVYLMTIFGRQQYDFRAYRSQNRHRIKEPRHDQSGAARVA